MQDIPKLKKRQDRKPLNIVVDKHVDELYREGKQNGWNVSEIARQAVTEKLESIKEMLKRPAS